MADGFRYDGLTKKLSAISNSSEAFVVTGSNLIVSGNIGIGTAVLSNALNVNGDISANSYVFGIAEGDVTSRTLDEYEEGAWTPGFRGDFIDPITYNSRVGNYIRVGNLVTFACTINVASGTSNGGPMFVTGLPYIQQKEPYAGVNIHVIQGFDTAFNKSLVANIEVETSDIAVYELISGSISYLTTASSTTDFIIHLFGSYYVYPRL